jgi:LPXTG-site transpeptidase (sortase) family protein
MAKSVTDKSKQPKPSDDTKRVVSQNGLRMNLLYNRALQPDPRKQEKARRKLYKLRRRSKWANLRFGLIAFAVFAVVFNYQFIVAQVQFYWGSRKVSQQPQTQQAKQEAETKLITHNVEAESVQGGDVIIIPKINVNAPIVFADSVAETAVLKALENGVVHYYGTANPGQPGNTVFFGHSSNDAWVPGNYKYVFVLLEKLVPGDIFEIHYSGKKYVYQVSATKVVQPNDLSVLRQTNEKTATLITCTPPGTSWRRFIVSANQIQPPQQPVQEIVEAPKAQPTATATILPSNSPSLLERITNFFSTLWASLTGHSVINN